LVQVIRVRYYSHVGLTTGYGRAAAELATALSKHHEVDLELVQIPATRPGWEGLDAYPHLAGLLRAPSKSPKAVDVILVHTLPTDCLNVLEDAMATSYDADGYQSGVPRSIAYTTYDGYHLSPEARRGLNSFTQVWVPSAANQSYTKDLLLGTGEDRVRFLPHTYDPSRTLPTRHAIGMERFRFYWIGAWSPRKNPEGLIRAYANAFSSFDDVELVIRSSVAPNRYCEALASTGLPEDQLPLITLINHELTDDEIWELHANADCYVTATRGECWDLGAFEAYLSRRMVITPATGSWAYLMGSDAKIVDVHPTLAHMAARATPAMGGFQIALDGQVGMTCRDFWRDPDLIQLSRTMRQVFTDRNRNLSWKWEPSDKFGHAVVARLAVDYMQHLLKTT
jgi:glycosyltransferase involved in cell wall biosynthesis